MGNGKREELKKAMIAYLVEVYGKVDEANVTGWLEGYLRGKG